MIWRGQKLGMVSGLFHTANELSTDHKQNTDEHGHGTHCAGTVAGIKTGVCKKGTVVAVKVLNSAGQGTYSAIIAGIQWGMFLPSSQTSNNVLILLHSRR